MRDGSLQTQHFSLSKFFPLGIEIADGVRTTTPHSHTLTGDDGVENRKKLFGILCFGQVALFRVVSRGNL